LRNGNANPAVTDNRTQSPPLVTAATEKPRDRNSRHRRTFRTLACGQMDRA
jgi:hypothetical protein